MVPGRGICRPCSILQIDIHVSPVREASSAMVTPRSCRRTRMGLPREPALWGLWWARTTGFPGLRSRRDFGVFSTMSEYTFSVAIATFWSYPSWMNDINTNPFKKIEGGKSEPQNPEPETGKICVLQGNMVVPVFGNKSGIVGPEGRGGGGQAVALEAKLFPCQKQRCVFWNAGAEDCSIKLGMEALIEMKGPLMALGHTFGARS